MTKMLWAAAVAAILAAGPGSAAVQTLSFDDISGTPTVTEYQGPFVAKYANYGGFTWGPSWAAVDAVNECLGFSCGLKNAKTSGEFIATNVFNDSGSITSATPFRLVSIQMGAAWHANLLVSIEGRLGGNLVWSRDVRVGAAGPMLVLFPTGMVDTLNVTPLIDGNTTHVYIAGSGPRMVWDDFSFDTAPVGGVPEPAAWAMLLSGFGLVGAVSRRQRSVAA